MKQYLVTAASALALGAGAVLSMTAIVPIAAKAAAAPAVRIQAATFAIQNMTCPLCPVTVKHAMEGVAGVRSVGVDFSAKTATVRFDPSKTTIAAIAKASTNAGYPARAKKS